jgi:hypothetical protein
MGFNGQSIRNLGNLKDPKGETVKKGAQEIALSSPNRTKPTR